MFAKEDLQFIYHYQLSFIYHFTIWRFIFIPIISNDD